MTEDLRLRRVAPDLTAHTLNERSLVKIEVLVGLCNGESRVEEELLLLGRHELQ